MELTKNKIKAIEDLGWSVQETEDGYVFRNYSPADGEMYIEEPTLEGVIDYCENFDADEEFDVWYGANRGEPSSPSALIEDCKEQERMYQELAELLRAED